MTVTGEQLKLDGIARSYDATPEGQRDTFLAIARQWVDAGVEFSADNLRDDLDAAGIPTRRRGGLMNALLATGEVVEVGTTKSRHPATHGKRIGVYRRAAS